MFFGYVLYRLLFGTAKLVCWTLWTVAVLLVALVVFLWNAGREIAGRHKIAKEAMNDE